MIVQFCKNCGIRLFSEHVENCPNCSSSERITAFVATNKPSNCLNCKNVNEYITNIIGKECINLFANLTDFLLESHKTQREIIADQNNQIKNSRIKESKIEKSIRIMLIILVFLIPLLVFNDLLILTYTLAFITISVTNVYVLYKIKN